MEIDWYIIAGNLQLVGGLEHVCFYLLGRVTPTDELIFFRGVGIPPTSHNIPHYGKFQDVPVVAATERGCP